MTSLLNRLLPADGYLDAHRLETEDAVLQACRASFQRAARSLSLIPAIIPQPLRDNIALLHGLCRTIDDAVDDAGDREPTAELTRLEAELFGIRTPGPLVRLALDRLPAMGIDPGLFRFLIEGVRRDLRPSAMRDDDELLVYSYHVAGVVSVMMCAALGVRRQRSVAYAIDLGIALQLTNLVRDWPADAARGRCYIPARRLAHYGLSPQRVIERCQDPTLPQELRPALEGLLRLGDVYYRSADAGVADVPLRYRHGVLLMGRIYRREGWRAATGGGSRPGRVSVPVWDRAALLLQVAGLALTPRVLGLIQPRAHDWRLHQAFAGSPGTHSAPVTSGPTPRKPGKGSRPWRRRGVDPARRVW